MKREITILTFTALLVVSPQAFARNGANVSITSGQVFVDDIHNLDYKVGHTGTYTFTMQIESDTTITGATLGFVLYSPDGSLDNVVWNTIPTNVGPWSEVTTWNFGGASLALGPDEFDGSLPSTWMTGGVSIPAPGAGYGPIGLTDALIFTITLPGVDGAVLCLDSAFFPPAGSWLALPAEHFEWAGGQGDRLVGGVRDNAFCVTTFVTSDVSTCPGSLSMRRCDTMRYQTFMATDSSALPLTYSITTSGTGSAAVDSVGNVTYIPGADEATVVLLTVTATGSDGTSSNCSTFVTLVNRVPALTCPSGARVTASDTVTTAPATVTDDDACDTHTFSLVSVDPTPYGVVTVDESTGAVTFVADSSDAQGGEVTDYTVCLSVTDGRDSDTCCITVSVLPYIPACPDTLLVSHCDILLFKAFDVNPDSGLGQATYSVTHTGVGAATVDVAGFVTYVPGLGESGEFLITTTATYPDSSTDECVTSVTVTNNRPTLICPPNIAIIKGGTSTSPPAIGRDIDACDALVYSLVSVIPMPLGTVTVDPSTGAVTFFSDVSDAVGGMDTDYDVTIEVTDGDSTAQCTMSLVVLNTEPFSVSIGQTDQNPPSAGTLQGQQVDLCINYEAGSSPVGGFDFIIQYDASALSFVGATAGNIFPDYGWEYFTYGFGPNGNCTGGCPSGKLRVVGIAEQNDGMNHPNNFQLVPGDEFACLTFLVSNDRNLGCQFAPVRWVWLDCGDNSLSSTYGDTMYISQNVYDYIGTDNTNVLSGRRKLITDKSQTFPTVFGAPDTCDVSLHTGVVIHYVDYKNGGVKIICPSDLDLTGDINVNGLANEIADAVMLSEYFVSGLSAFGSHIEGSITASEMNCDGVPLTVADFVYLTRIINGTAVPCPQLDYALDTAMIADNQGEIVSDKALGGALFVFDGIANVNLLANNMDMKTGVVDGVTHVLVYNITTTNEFIHPGPVLQSDSKLLSVDVSDTLGVTMISRFDFVTDVTDNDNSLLPKAFALGQNYPNPFNPTTTISIDFPRQSEYTLTFYNIRGQKVAQYHDMHSGGTLNFIWEPGNLPSGVYLYKFHAEGFTATKKLVLLK